MESIQNSDHGGGAAPESEVRAAVLPLSGAQAVAIPVAAVASAAVPMSSANDRAAVDDVFFRELYDREWVRRDQLQAAVGTPLTFLTAVAGALWYLFQQAFGSSDAAPLRWAPFFAVSFSFATVSFVAATAALIRSFVGYTYKMVPYAQTLLNNRIALHAHYRALGHVDSRVADDEFRADLESCYAGAAEHNARCNTERAAWLFRSNSIMAAALLFAALSAVPIARTMRATPRSPQQVQLVDSPPPTAPSMTEPTKKTTTPAPAPTNQQQPTVPPKPAPLQNLDVRGNDSSPQPRPEALPIKPKI